MFLAEGASVQYPVQLSTTGNNNVYFYAASPINTIGATLSTTGSGASFNNWYDGFTLPAGDYIMQATLHGDYTGSSGLDKFQFREGGTNRGAAGVNLDPSNTSSTEYPGEAVSYMTLSSSTLVNVRLRNVTASNSTTSNLQAERGYLLIMKVN